MSEGDKRPLVIIGTSGSTDYLKDTTGNHRYWPVEVPSGDVPPLDEADAEVVKKLVELTGGTWIVEAKPRLKVAPVAEACDGLHDEGAPAQYLCSRCHPDRNDLDGGADPVEYDGEVPRDEP